MGLITTCIRIDEDKFKEIKHYCVDEEINQSQWIGEAIDLKLKTYKED